MRLGFAHINLHIINQQAGFLNLLIHLAAHGAGGLVNFSINFMAEADLLGEKAGAHIFEILLAGQLPQHDSLIFGQQFGLRFFHAAFGEIGNKFAFIKRHGPRSLFLLI